MTIWDVYLEVAERDRCMAHVSALPGCFVRDDDRAVTERRLPDAIRWYTGWLAGRGETVENWRNGDEIRIAGIAEGIGPFEHGDAAMLMPHEREQLTDADLEHAIRLAGYNREELLAAINRLDDISLDRKPAPDEMSIREILRHIGNVEQWYLSRIVEPESLPPEWQDDERLPIFEFLNMERRTVIKQFRSLSPTARCDVFYPSRWTDHPDEPWTARKALRRLLEHEREHLMQIQESLFRGE